MSTHARLTERSRSAHGSLPSGREGKGREGNGSVVLHASYLTTREPRPVDNPHAAANAAPHPQAACNAFGEVRRWGL